MINNKSIMFFLSVIFLVACQGSKQKMNDWNQYNLKGKVKELTKTVYNDYRDIVAKRKGVKTITRFAKTGMLYDYARHLPSGETQWLKYEYQGDSVIAQAWLELNSGNETWQGKWIYILDERNAQKKIIQILKTKEVGYIMNVTTNNRGCNTEMRYTNKVFPERLPCSVKHIFDANNYLIEEHLFAYEIEKKSCFDTPIIIYKKNNEQGDVIREKNKDRAGKIVSKIAYVYQYDKHNNWIEKRSYENDALKQTVLRKIVYY